MISRSLRLSGGYGTANAFYLVKAAELQNLPSVSLERMMRSELVFASTSHISNRFLLVGVAAKATRKLHRPNTRIQETMNEVFSRFAQANPIAGVQRADSAQSLHLAEKVQTQSRNRRQSKAAA